MSFIRMGGGLPSTSNKYVWYKYRIKQWLLKDGDQRIEWDNTGYPLTSGFTSDGGPVLQSNNFKFVGPSTSYHNISVFSKDKVKISGMHLKVDYIYDSVAGTIDIDCKDVDEAYIGACIYNLSSVSAQASTTFKMYLVSEKRNFGNFEVITTDDAYTKTSSTAGKVATISRMWLEGKQFVEKLSSDDPEAYQEGVDITGEWLIERMDNKVYLYNEGNERTDLTGGFSVSNVTNGYYEYKKNAKSLTVNALGSPSGLSQIATPKILFQTNSEIDVKDYQKLCFKVKTYMYRNNTGADSTGARAIFGIFDTLGNVTYGNHNTISGSTATIRTPYEGIVTVDVSNLSKARIGLYEYGSDYGSVFTSISAIWLEKKDTKFLYKDGDSLTEWDNNGNYINTENYTSDGPWVFDNGKLVATVPTTNLHCRTMTTSNLVTVRDYSSLKCELEMDGKISVVTVDTSNVVSGYIYLSIYKGSAGNVAFKLGLSTSKDKMMNNLIIDTNATVSVSKIGVTRVWLEK